MLDPRWHLAFFDSAKVIAAVDAATRKTMSRIGAFVWQRERTSLRKSKNVAAPGKPPRSHAGQLRDLNYFAYDDKTKSVVVGPVKFKDGTVPRLLEEGGDVMRPGPDGKTRLMHYAPHPFLAPALAAEVAAGTIPKEWSNAVKA